MDVTIIERQHRDAARWRTLGAWRVLHEMRLGTHGQHHYSTEGFVAGDGTDGPDPMHLARYRDAVMCAMKRIRLLRRARVPIVFHVKLTTED